MEQVVWKPIPGYEGLYKISEYGDVVSLPRNGTIKSERLLKQQMTKGYKSLKLCKNDIVIRYMIHKLVAKAFLKKKRGSQCINHKDGNKLNNHYTNLEYTTFKENTIHAWKIGLCEKARERIRKYSTGRNGELNGKSIAIVQIDIKTKKVINQFVSATFAATETGINRQTISRCCSGTRKTAGGFMWAHSK
jgi:hypothetical protein